MKKLRLQCYLAVFSLLFVFACGDSSQKKESQEAEAKSQEEVEAHKEKRRKWAVRKLDEGIEEQEDEAGEKTTSIKYIQSPEMLYEKEADEVQRIFVNMVEKYQKNLKEVEKDWADHPDVHRHITAFEEEATLYHEELQSLKEEGLASDEELKEEYIQYLQNMHSEYEYILMKMIQDK